MLVRGLTVIGMMADKEENTKSFYRTMKKGIFNLPDDFFNNVHWLYLARYAVLEFGIQNNLVEDVDLANMELDSLLAEQSQLLKTACP